MEPMQDTDVLSTEDLSALKSKMTAEDKQTLYDLFTNKIAPEQINAISKLFENGINQIEVDAMKAELNKHLTDKEMEKIVEIFRKYTS
jgi:signal-transduction protein with cAMP-binding, CBS, and nucleotidyltransferase domain